METTGALKQNNFLIHNNIQYTSYETVCRGIARLLLLAVPPWTSLHAEGVEGAATKLMQTFHVFGNYPVLHSSHKHTHTHTVQSHHNNIIASSTCLFYPHFQISCVPPLGSRPPPFLLSWSWCLTRKVSVTIIIELHNEKFLIPSSTLAPDLPTTFRWFHYCCCCCCLGAAQVCGNTENGIITRNVFGQPPPTLWCCSC